MTTLIGKQIHHTVNGECSCKLDETEECEFKCLYKPLSLNKIIKTYPKWVFCSSLFSTNLKGIVFRDNTNNVYRYVIASVSSDNGKKTEDNFTGLIYNPRSKEDLSAINIDGSDGKGYNMNLHRLVITNETLCIEYNGTNIVCGYGGNISFHEFAKSEYYPDKTVEIKDKDEIIDINKNYGNIIRIIYCREIDTYIVITDKDYILEYNSNFTSENIITIANIIVVDNGTDEANDTEIISKITHGVYTYDTVSKKYQIITTTNNGYIIYKKFDPNSEKYLWHCYKLCENISLNHIHFNLFHKLYVVVGSNNTIFCSRDGENWYKPNFMFNTNYDFYSVAYNRKSGSYIIGCENHILNTTPMYINDMNTYNELYIGRYEEGNDIIYDSYVVNDIFTAADKDIIICGIFHGSDSDSKIHYENINLGLIGAIPNDFNIQLSTYEEKIFATEEQLTKYPLGCIVQCKDGEKPENIYGFGKWTKISTNENTGLSEYVRNE